MLWYVARARALVPIDLNALLRRHPCTLQKLGKKVADPEAALALAQDAWRVTAALVHQPIGQALCLFAYGVRVLLQVTASGCSAGEMHACCMMRVCTPQEVMALVHHLPEAARAFQAAGELLEVSLQRCPHVGRDLLQWEAWQPSPLTAKCWENVVVRGERVSPVQGCKRGRQGYGVLCVPAFQAAIAAMRRADGGLCGPDAEYFKDLELQALRKLLVLAKRLWPAASEQVAGHTASVAMALNDLGRLDEACASMQVAIWGRVVITAEDPASGLPPVCRPHSDSTVEHLLMLMVRRDERRGRGAPFEAAGCHDVGRRRVQALLNELPWADRFSEAVVELYVHVERELCHDWTDIIFRRARAVVRVRVCVRARAGARMCTKKVCTWNAGPPVGKRQAGRLGRNGTSVPPPGCPAPVRGAAIGAARVGGPGQGAYMTVPCGLLRWVTLSR